MADVRMTFTSDDKDVQKSLDAMTKKMQALADANRKLKEEAKEAKDAQEDQFGAKALSDIGSMAAGYLSVGAAIGAVSSAIDELKRKQDAAKNSQTDVANPERAFMLNFLPGSEAEANAARVRVSEIAKAAKVSPADAYRVATPAVSATNNETQLWSAVETALKVQPGNIDEAAAVAGGLGDISKLTGSNNMDANLGLLLKAAKQARVENLRMVAQNLIPGAMGVKAGGGTADQAVGLVTALTKQSADATGASTGTAAIQLSNQLQEALPAMGSFDERLRYMVANEKEREKFLEKATFEQKAKAPIADMLRGGDGFKLYEEYSKGTATDAQLAGNAGNVLGAINSQPIQKVEELARSLENISNDSLIGDNAGATIATMRQGVQKFRSDVLGMTGVTGGWASSGADVVQGMFMSPEGFAQQKIQELEGYRGYAKGDEEMTKSLDRMIAVLERVANASEATKENTRGKLNIDANAE